MSYKKRIHLNAVNDLNFGLNNLLSDFSCCDSKTQSVLFRSYCMEVHAVKLKAFNQTYLKNNSCGEEKAIRRIWKLPYRTHNNLLHLINLCSPINVALEKRSNKNNMKIDK